MATFISIVVGVIAMTAYFLKLETYVSFDRSQWRPEPSVWWQMLGIGIPAGGEFLLIGVYSFLIYIVINRFGSAAQAGFGTGVRIMQMLFVPVMAVAFAASPVAGQNYGARSAERVKQTFRSAALITVGIMAVLTVLAHLVPDKLVSIFLTDQAAIAFGSEYFRMVSWNFAASGLIFVISAMFQSMGNSWPPLFSSAFRLTLFMAAILWMASRPDFAIIHVWQISVASVLLQAGVNLALLYREFGRKLTFASEPAPVQFAPDFPEM
jgi:Na+-driven multidrug efflux pump